jgi:hypothetical protein
MEKQKNGLLEKQVNIEVVQIENETFFKIANHNLMRPFLMSIVSQSNHWMYILSNGGMTAGRKNADLALFPYYTEDKLTDLAEVTGSKSIFQINDGVRTVAWEPLTEHCDRQFQISRNLYKSQCGNKILFEEINHDLAITFRYQWNTSNLFGFVRKAELINHSKNDYSVSMIDGLQNILPHGVSSYLQNNTSNLVDAYKRSELHPETGLGIFALSAIISDRAEPSESLKANVAWSSGIQNSGHLLSSLQINDFRKFKKIKHETDIKGEKGAYFICADFDLPKSSLKDWKIIANVNQDQSQIIGLGHAILKDPELDQKLEDDIRSGTELLMQQLAQADGLQYSADQFKDSRHLSNVLFNIMRGGVFDENYQIEKKDFSWYLAHANKQLFNRSADFLKRLPAVFNKTELEGELLDCNDVDLIRLSKEYLPLKFSRRHGDPSRPWNKFSINTHSETDGSKILDFEGNWRDIFQNWEALVYSYPGFIEGMIFKFLNASTFDGYNPYRITKDGFDWEIVEKDNPWSNIGYWGDHQIIYLLKFLEFAQQYQPDILSNVFHAEYFVYAHVPYRIQSYHEILIDPKNTIEFDVETDKRIRKEISDLGADGALLKLENGEIYHVNFLEKILATTLAKISNFIPEGGIWMNTQRPEWNDANNALVGNGVSMVTLYYLRRFLSYFSQRLSQIEKKDVYVSTELAIFFDKLNTIFENHQNLLEGPFSNADRRIVVDALSHAGSDFRDTVYEYGFSGRKTLKKVDEISKFMHLSLFYFDHTIRANKRADDLFHAYNLLTIHRHQEMSLDHLSEMLEGQVAVISSGYLNSGETLRLLDALRASELYRADQNSYVLYPDRGLPGFLNKNIIPPDLLARSVLLQSLIEKNNQQIVIRDVNGQSHFNGSFKNAGDLNDALTGLESGDFREWAIKDRNLILNIFENVFNHKSFTGRSGTFFAYEGLGSIYWHMVSKLYLAVQEACLRAINNREESTLTDRLVAHFYEVGNGIGIHKSPELYGAFPTDPYSHTPLHRGAQQPGMTGQVKEDILVRFGELGIQMKDGIIHFRPTILRRSEFLKSHAKAHFFNVFNIPVSFQLEAGMLAFTYCQVPVIYCLSTRAALDVYYSDGARSAFDGSSLDLQTSQKIFQRTGEILKIHVFIEEESLRE